MLEEGDDMITTFRLGTSCSHRDLELVLLTLAPEVFTEVMAGYQMQGDFVNKWLDLYLPSWKEGGHFVPVLVN